MTTNKYKLKNDEFLDAYPVHEQVKSLLNLPQFEQRSAEWFAQRKTRLTSSDIDTVLGNNKYGKPEDVLFKKCNLGKPFNGNVFTKHGQHYEEEAIEKYCEHYSKRVYSFGLLPHPTIEWIGGSPDDITTDGIVLEVKCPYSRKIIMGEVPKHYEAQVKMNMEIADLDKAVFIEYKPATETDDYILNVVEFTRDPAWLPSVIDELKTFWDSVLQYRQNGIDTHKLYDYYKALNTEKVCISFSSEMGFIMNSQADNDIMETCEEDSSDDEN